jgi:hypothetical protein
MIELHESIAGDLPVFIEMEQDTDTSGFILPLFTRTVSI